MTELQPSERWCENKINKIGVAINPSLALINHSCDPNYARVERGKDVMAFATRRINAGEEILDVYSGTWVASDMETRSEVHNRSALPFVKNSFMPIFNFVCQFISSDLST